MSPAVRETLESWSLPVPVTLVLALTAAIYARGWYRLRRAPRPALGFSQLAFFEGGIFALWIAIGSPFEAFNDELLSMHMMQHLLLMSVAPPLLLLGAPMQPILHGLPTSLVRGALGPIARQPSFRWIARALTEPWVGWVAATAALIGWHLPPAFERAVQSESWHEVEHATFFLTSILFWWPVVQPWPSVARWPRWSVVPYLFLGMLANDALSAFMTFYPRVLYPSYETARKFAITPIEDQALSGALMWAFGTFVYLVPAVLVAVQLLSPHPERATGVAYPEPS
jgi:cytochrome c oxidase assembly factor CtaG